NSQNPFMQISSIAHWSSVWHWLPPAAPPTALQRPEPMSQVPGWQSKSSEQAAQAPALHTRPLLHSMVCWHGLPIPSAPPVPIIDGSWQRNSAHFHAVPPGPLVAQSASTLQFWHCLSTHFSSRSTLQCLSFLQAG